MCPQRAATPAGEPCLSKPYSSRPNQKGGTLIVAAHDLASHRRMLRNPDECRPKACRCGGTSLHVHGVRERYPRELFDEGEPVPVVQILVFICTSCRATWRILPAFLPRCLWRSWEVVELEIQGGHRPRDVPPVPPRTVQRWRARLRQSAYLPAQVLVVAGGALREIVLRLTSNVTRAQLVQAWAGGFAALAELLHRIAPGVRLM